MLDRPQLLQPPGATLHGQDTSSCRRSTRGQTPAARGDNPQRTFHCGNLSTDRRSLREAKWLQWWRLARSALARSLPLLRRPPLPALLRALRTNRQPPGTKHQNHSSASPIAASRRSFARRHHLISFALIFFKIFRLKSRGPPNNLISDVVIGSPSASRRSIR